MEIEIPTLNMLCGRKSIRIWTEGTYH